MLVKNDEQMLVFTSRSYKRRRLRTYKFQTLPPTEQRILNILYDQCFDSDEQIMMEFNKDNIIHLLLNQMNIRYVKRALRPAEFTRLAEILSLPLDFFKKNYNKETLNIEHAAKQLLEALNTLIAKPQCKQLLKIYLSKEFVGYRKAFRNAINSSNDRDDLDDLDVSEVTNAKTQLDLYTAAQVIEITKYRGDEKPDKVDYEIALIFILSYLGFVKDSKTDDGDVPNDYLEDSYAERLRRADLKVQAPILSKLREIADKREREMTQHKEFNNWRNNWQYIQRLNVCLSFMMLFVHFSNHFLIIGLIITISFIFDIYNINKYHVYKDYAKYNSNSIIMNDMLCIALISLGFLSVLYSLCMPPIMALSILFKIYAFILFCIFLYYSMWR